MAAVKNKGTSEWATKTEESLNENDWTAPHEERTVGKVAGQSKMYRRVAVYGPWVEVSQADLDAENKDESDNAESGAPVAQDATPANTFG